MCCAEQSSPFFLVQSYAGGFGLKGSASQRFAFPLINSLVLTVAGASVSEESALCCSLQSSLCEMSLYSFELIPTMESTQQTLIWLKAQFVCLLVRSLETFSFCHLLSIYTNRL